VTAVANPPREPAAPSPEATLLALETATLVASVAVVAGPLGAVAPAVRVLGRAAAEVTTHSETLLLLVDEALRQAGLTVDGLDRIGCGAGPGSFTGLRIGLCTAKGLAFAAGKPLVLASSLRALALAVAADVGGEPLIAVVLDAKQGEVYVGLYRGAAATPLGAAVALAPGDVAAHVAGITGGAPLLVCGTALAAYRDMMAALPGARLHPAPSAPDAALVARLCLESPPTDLATATPSYVMHPRLRVSK